MNILSEKFMRFYTVISLVTVIALAVIVVLMWRTQAKIHNNVLFVSEQLDALSDDVNVVRRNTSDISNISRTVDSMESAIDSIEYTLRRL